MGHKFWIRRFLVIFVGAFAIITGVQYLKHRDSRYAIEQGLLWAGITAIVFVAARVYQSRKGQQCAICQDTPEIQRRGRPSTLP